MKKERRDLKREREEKGQSPNPNPNLNSNLMLLLPWLPFALFEMVCQKQNDLAIFEY